MFSNIDASSYTNLQNYVSYLFDGYLEQCVQENKNLIEKFRPSVLSELEDRTEAELDSYLADSLKDFLSGIISGECFEKNIEAAKKWKKGKLEILSKGQISTSHILIIFSIRKQLLIGMLSTYTDDCQKIIQIIKEIEVFFLQLEHNTIETYVEIQKEAILEEKEFSESIFNNSIDGILSWDHNFTITAWNAVLEKQYNIKKEEIVGKNYFDVFPAYIGTKQAMAMENVLKGKKTYFPAHPYLYKEGFYEMNLVPLKDARGNISGGLTIVHDVTEQKKAETSILDHREELQTANEILQAQQEELRQAHQETIEKKIHLEQNNLALEKEVQARIEIEKELKNEKSFIKAILDNMREGVVACDNNGTLTFFNEASINFHGRTHENSRFPDWPTAFKLYHPDGEKLMQPEDVPLYKALRGEQVKDTEMLVCSPDGTKYMLSVNGQPIFDDNGDKKGAVLVMHNVTKRKKAEEELRKSHDFYLTILQDFPALIWRSDIHGNCDYFNNTWLEFTGRSMEQELGYGWAEGVHPEDFEQCVAIYNESFKAQKHFSMQYRLKNKNGKYRWLIDFGKPLYAPDQSFLGFLGVCYDIQEQKEAEKEISEKNKALTQALEKLKTAEDHLLKINSELESRVRSRTDELLASEEELKQTLEQTIKLNDIISQREEFLSSIIDQTPISTSIFDATGNQIRVNRAYNNLFRTGSDDEQQVRYNIFEDAYLMKTPHFEDIKKVFSEGKIAQFTIDYNLSQLKQPSGTADLPITLTTTIFPIKDAENNVINAVVQHEDMTERKKAEEALRQSEEQHRLITDALPVLVAYVDKHERYRFNNKAYENWFNVSRKDIIGKTVREVVGDIAYSSLKSQIQKALAGENFYYEAYLPYKDAGKRFVAVNYIPRVVNNQVEGYYTLINDISKQKEVQRALEIALQETNDKNEELQKINNDLDNFIYIASHDLKSPIVNLEGLVASLKRKIALKSSGEEKKVLEMIQISIDKFKETLKNLTEVTKAQKNLEEEKEIISFPEVIREVKHELQAMIIESKADITEEIEVEELYFVPMNLRSILYNLLTNAIKYRKPEVPLQILIRTRSQGSNIVLSVKDNGLGLSKSQQGKLFKMFKRMHSHVEGTGIGLYILKRIAENSGGKVEVESEENVGTEFRIYFRNNQ